MFLYVVLKDVYFSKCNAEFRKETDVLEWAFVIICFDYRWKHYLKTAYNNKIYNHNMSAIPLHPSYTGAWTPALFHVSICWQPILSQPARDKLHALLNKSHCHFCTDCTRRLHFPEKKNNFQVSIYHSFTT